VFEGRTTNEPIRVLLADDHTLFLQGLAGVLASYGSMEIIAEVLARQLCPLPSR
jgi:DNA-binding NarL/FixJ family response regulator